MLKRILLALLLLVPISAHAADVVVHKVRTGFHGDKTRVVLESNLPLKPEHFALPSPARYVLDFGEIEFEESMSSVELVENGLVNGIRQGRFKPGTIRMVLDLKKPAIAKIFSIPKTKKTNHRLVVDLYPASDAQIKDMTAKASKMIEKQASQDPQPVMKAVGKSSPIVVVVDPGHGGVDPGAIGKYKTYEKNVNLAVAKYLRSELDKIPNVKAYLTRYDDRFIPLKERVAIAQGRHADIFVSLHADANRDRRVRGSSVYVLSEKSSDKEAARLARMANEGDLIAGIRMDNEPPQVRDILIDLAQRETKNKSAMLAQEVLRELNKSNKLRVRKDKIMFAGFRVLKAPEIPSILVEMSYLSNPTEEKLLRTKSHQRHIAQVVANGVEDYIKKHMHK